MLVSLLVPSFAWREIHFPIEGTGCHISVPEGSLQLCVILGA